MMKYILALAMFLSLAAPAFENSRQAAAAAEASFRAGQLEKYLGVPKLSKKAPSRQYDLLDGDEK